MAKIIVFGGNGFVGSNVMEVLQEDGMDCVSASRINEIDLKNNLSTSEFLKRHKPEFIVNCAAHVGSLNYVTEQAANVIADNSRMILGMYEAIAASCPKAIVINPIANCAYPAKADTFIEDNWWDGHLHRSVLSYGSSRRLLWTIGECFQMQYGIKSINLLVPNMYGPHDSTDPNKAHALNALISKFVKAKETNSNEITIWGTGVAIREWLYAKDFGRIVEGIIKNPNMLGLAEPINIAQNFGLSVRELVEIIITNFDYKGSIKWDSTMPDGAPKKVMDDRKFKKVFPEFKFTPFEIGVKNAIQYYNSKYPY
jgi:GDP-L-fucose synthase